MKIQGRHIALLLIITLTVVVISTLIFRGEQESDSRVNWTFTAGYKWPEIALGEDGSIYAGLIGSEEESTIFRISSNGKQIWGCQVPGRLRDGPVLGPKGEVYAMDGFGKLFCVSESGDFLWERQIGSYGGKREIAVSDSRLYIGSVDHHLYAVDLQGNILWSYYTDMLMANKPGIGEDGRIYIGGKSALVKHPKFFCFTPDGDIAWEFSLNTGVTTNAAISQSNHIYFGTDDGLVCLTINGEHEWTALQGRQIWSDPSLAEDGTIFCGTPSGHYFAINPDGSTRWQLTLKKTSHSMFVNRHGSIVHGNDTVYLAAGTPDVPQVTTFDLLRTLFGRRLEPELGGTLYAVDQLTGAVQWEFEADDSLEGDFAVGSGGTVYICSWEGKLYCLSP